eukprot:TRINITY_DN80545_c0_g1_i1.p1 TRINITY_DN80545_c0_g1~~TRINITY_DN80545_c0_g1_i1.p1  ORF type:complete len:411 (+),score=130.88 TRINITY_DN80545_c0_g1_i1:64-1296(+)
MAMRCLQSALLLLSFLSPAQTSRRSQGELLVHDLQTSQNPPSEIHDAVRLTAEQAHDAKKNLAEHEREVHERKTVFDAAEDHANQTEQLKRELEEAVSKHEQEASIAEAEHHKAVNVSKESSESHKAAKTAAELLQKEKEEATAALEKRRSEVEAEKKRLDSEVDAMKVEVENLTTRADEARQVAEDLSKKAETAGQTEAVKLQAFQAAQVRVEESRERLVNQTAMSEKAEFERKEAQRLMDDANKVVENSRRDHQAKTELAGHVKKVRGQINDFSRTLEKLIESMEERRLESTEKPWVMLKQNADSTLSNVFEAYNSIATQCKVINELDATVYKMMDPAMDKIRDAAKAAIRGQCDPRSELKNETAEVIRENCGIGLWKAVGMKMELLPEQGSEEVPDPMLSETYVLPL